MSGKFFEVNKGSNQHQKFIVDEDHDDEGYGVESDDGVDDIYIMIQCLFVCHEK